MSDTGTVVLMLFLVMMSGYFSATETAFNSLSTTKMKIEAEHGNKKASLVLRLLDDYNRLLTTILVGNNIVNIALASIATVWFIKLIGDSGATVSTAVITVVVLIFGEITPKSLAKENPESFALFSAPIINFLGIILTPINLIFSLWKKLLSRTFKGGEDRSLTEEELLTIVDEVEQSGTISEQEGDLIRSALELNDSDAADIATPRVDITAVPLDSTKKEIMDVFADSQYSRIPVYDETIDNIVGILLQSDFYREGGRLTEERLQKPLFVPRTIKIGALLKEMQKSKCHMAVVTDEYGGTYGIVTMEDILEELVGEIWDEHDEVEEEVTEDQSGILTVSGLADPEELLGSLGIERELKVATVGGWVMDELGKVPEVGDTFETDGIKVTVTETDGMRVDTVEIEKLSDDSVQAEQNA